MKKKLMAALSAALILLLSAGCGSATQPAATDYSWLLPTAAQAADVVREQIEEFRDDYFYYYTHEDYELLMGNYSGSFGGVGVSMILNEEGQIEIYAIIDGSPASGTEIAEGDIIISVDGTSLEGYDTSMAATLIRGQVGSAVTLGMRRPDASEYSVLVVRDIITDISVEGELFLAAPHTGYIYISDFTEQTPNQFLDIYEDLEEQALGLDHIIIDLRSDGGGSLNAALSIANFFVPAGRSLMEEKTPSGLRTYQSSDGSLYGVDIIILVNQYSASASEVLSGSLLDQCDATLIGVTTFGKGITQSMEALPSGAGLRHTRSIYYTPSGFSLHGVGLTPQVELTIPDEVTREEYWSLDPAVSQYMAAVLEHINNR